MINLYSSSFKIFDVHFALLQIYAKDFHLLAQLVQFFPKSESADSDAASLPKSFERRSSTKIPKSFAILTSVSIFGSEIPFS